MNKKNVIIIISILAFIMLVGGISYSYFVYNKDIGSVSLETGEISIDLSNINGNQTLSNLIPVSDYEGKNSNNYFDFTVTSTVDTERIYYEVYILPKGSNTLDTSYLKTYLTDQNNNEIKGTIIYSDLLDSEIDNGKVIYRNIIETNNGVTSNETKNFRLRLWLDENYDESSSKSFNFDIYLYAKNVSDDFKLPIGSRLLTEAITLKEQNNSCSNITYEEDNITYLSGTSECIDMNYVWYSGKLWRITEIYSDGAMKLITQNNITSISFNEDGNNVFYTNENNKSYVYQWLNEDFFDSLYYPNNFIDTSKQWNASVTESNTIKPTNTTMVSANVGLLNGYEHYNSYRCIGSAACTGDSYSSSYLNIDYTWELITPAANSLIQLISTAGTYDQGYLTSSYGVRPSIIIKGNVEFTGNGTINNPYKIIGDKKVAKANDKINTRLSGEYVKLKNGNSEQVFRIINVEDDKTKIIAMDYANGGNTRKLSTASGGENSIWGQGKTTDADTWYTYLNNTYYPNLVSTYGNLFDNGKYFLGITSNYYYKNTRSLSDEFIVGLSSYGEIFATQQAGGYNTSIVIWLINRTINPTNVWGINTVCGGSNTSPTNLRGARPTLHLKSTVKILSGSGTQNDPYVVGI